MCVYTAESGRFGSHLVALFKRLDTYIYLLPAGPANRRTRNKSPEAEKEFVKHGSRCWLKDRRAAASTTGVFFSNSKYIIWQKYHQLNNFVCIAIFGGTALIKPLNQLHSPVYANASAFAQINQHEPSLTFAVLTYLITIKERRNRPLLKFHHPDWQLWDVGKKFKVNFWSDMSKTHKH